MPEYALQEENEAMPEPSATLVLWRVHVEAMVSIMGRKRGERYLRLMGEKLAAEQSLSAVFQIRPNSQQAAVRAARRQAATVYERSLPLFLARL